MRSLFILLLMFSVLFSATYVVSVPANIKWTNTSVYLEEGQPFNLTASGTWRYDPRPYFETDADGLVDSDNYNGRLMAKIGDSEFFVGKSFVGKAPVSGYLLLGMYDTTDYRNNEGVLKVILKVGSNLAEPETNLNSSDRDNPAEVVDKLVSNATDKVNHLDQTSKTVCAGFVLLVLGVLLFARDVENTVEDD